MSLMPVFYNPKQNAANSNESVSPSASKPQKVLENWQQLGLPIDVMDFSPLSAEIISMAHSPFHVSEVMSLQKANGFSNRDPGVAASLPWTTGSMLAAAQYALKTGNSTVSLTSGFHHAGYDYGHGFCTFNGLMIAALYLREQGLAKKIAIIDLDMHHGDGTEDIIKKCNVSEFIRNYSFASSNVSREKADKWLGRLPDFVKQFKGYDLILYNAGVDPHVDDPLGGVLTSEQLRLRDQIVFQTARKLQIPVAVSLAGGYQKPIEKVLAIHEATARECIKANYKGV